MGKNLTPWSSAIGDENVYFLTPLFKFNKKEKVTDIELLKKKVPLIHLIIMFKLWKLFV